MLPDKKFQIIELTYNLLRAIGEDTEREGLRETPGRVAKAWEQLLSGYDDDPKQYLKIFHEPSSDEMILIRNINLVSVCEHHMLPFIGKAHIAYIPGFASYSAVTGTYDTSSLPVGPTPSNERILLGLSKFHRIVRSFSRRLQVQEKLTTQIADFLNSSLVPLGIGVAIEASHLCSSIRGVEDPDSTMRTSALKGVFRDQEATRNEFLHLIGWGSR